MNNEKDILVSVCVIAYNHSKYIEKCLNGIVSQETNFKFEVIVHDDASQDNTQQIIKKFHQKFPYLIVPVLQKENQYSQGIKIWPQIVFPLTRGKYIALCEGDDYWTDSLKLQKQVDFMEENPDCSLCFHAVKIKTNNKSINIRYSGNNVMDINEYLIKDPFPATASLLFRSKIYNHYKSWMYYLFAGDFVLRYLSFFEGNIGYIDDIMCVYNRGVEGSWSSQEITIKKALQEYADNYKMLTYIKNNNKTLSGEAFQSKRLRLRRIAILRIARTKSKISGLIYLLNRKETSLRMIIHYTRP